MSEVKLTINELENIFPKWMDKVHPDKRDVQIQRIVKGKIYFTYKGSEGESIIHTKLLEDLKERGLL